MKHVTWHMNIYATRTWISYDDYDFLNELLRWQRIRAPTSFQTANGFCWWVCESRIVQSLEQKTDKLFPTILLMIPAPGWVSGKTYTHSFSFLLRVTSVYRENSVGCSDKKHVSNATTLYFSIYFLSVFPSASWHNHGSSLSNNGYAANFVSAMRNGVLLVCYCHILVGLGRKKNGEQL